MAVLTLARDKANWKGVKCSHNSSVFGLQLENMGQSEELNIEALAKISTMRAVTLMNNNIGGELPDMKKLGGSFRNLYLSKNKFEGEIEDDAFIGMNSSRKLYLSYNNFTGKVPSSLAGLPKLLELGLDNNGFEGQLPDYSSEDLASVGFSNKKFDGHVPNSLNKFSSASFSGNAGLCGTPLSQCKA